MSKQTAGASVRPESLPPARPAQSDLVVVMGRLARLRDADVLTEDEFQRERVKVVEGWTPPQSLRPKASRGKAKPA